MTTKKNKNITITDQPVLLALAIIGIIALIPILSIIPFLLMAPVMLLMIMFLAPLFGMMMFMLTAMLAIFINIVIHVSPFVIYIQ